MGNIPDDLRIAVVGLGYVGLPVAVGLARHFPNVTGFDINERRIRELSEGIDRTEAVKPEALAETTLKFSADEASLDGHNFIVVAVPTPIDGSQRPDLTPLLAATRTVGRHLTKGSTIVFESTVYPGVTEELCGPALAQESGLEQSKDFKLGYSPERINPGDDVHTLENITKVVSGEDQETLDLVAQVYGRVVTAGVHPTTNIKVAEAAKVIENTQRDLNIALMNEFALIFDLLDIRSAEVFEAAKTKWNFLPFFPGLVGGHCIGVDPYYLTSKAEEVGYRPEVILAGRRINDNMGKYVAQKTVKLMAAAGLSAQGGRVAVLGLSFKDNVADLRNSRVPDIVAELREFGAQVLVHDPLADADEAHEEYGIELSAWEDLRELDAVVVAVAHDEFLQRPVTEFVEHLRKGGVFIDVRSKFDTAGERPDLSYWSL